MAQKITMPAANAGIMIAGSSMELGGIKVSPTLVILSAVLVILAIKIIDKLLIT